MSKQSRQPRASGRGASNAGRQGVGHPDPAARPVGAPANYGIARMVLAATATPDIQSLLADLKRSRRRWFLFSVNGMRQYLPRKESISLLRAVLGERGAE